MERAAQEDVEALNECSRKNKTFDADIDSDCTEWVKVHDMSDQIKLTAVDEQIDPIEPEDKLAK